MLRLRQSYQKKRELLGWTAANKTFFQRKNHFLQNRPPMKYGDQKSYAQVDAAAKQQSGR
jgi:hypothetical protein